MRPTLALRPDDLRELLDTPAANDVDARRPALRSMASWSLRAELGGLSSDNLFADLSYDVTRGGVFVATWDPPPVGARVDVTLALPDGSELVLAGVVRWIRGAELASDGVPAGCGVEWKGLPLEAARALADWATAREPVLYLPEVAA